MEYSTMSFAAAGSILDFEVSSLQLPKFYSEPSTSGPINMPSSGPPSPFHFLSSDTSNSSFPSVFNGLLTLSKEDYMESNGSKGSKSRYGDCVCQDMTCDACMAEVREAWSNSHSPDYVLSQAASTGTPSPPLQNSHPLGLPFACCYSHSEPMTYYCRTCSSSVCKICAVLDHTDHIKVTLSVAMEAARIQTNLVLREALCGIKAINDDHDNVSFSATTLSLRAKQASDDVTAYTRRMVMALEEREKDLLQQIERARIEKMTSLRTRDDILRRHLHQLEDKTHQLMRNLEATRFSVQPLDYFLIKDRIAADVYRIRQTRNMLSPPEECWISFNVPEKRSLDMVANLGSIALNNPGSIGDRRALRGRCQTDAQLSLHKRISCIPIAKEDPIPGNETPVIVWTQKDNAPLSPTCILTFGDGGHPADNLCRPWGIACDNDGNVIVADRSNNQIQIFREEDGSFVRKFGSYGTGPGQFDRPAGVAVDVRRRIIVADKDNHRIQILTMDGIFIRLFGEQGSREGQFNYPWDVAVNSECQIVVSDSRNHRIQLFSPEGVFLRKFGSENSTSFWKTLDTPRGVSFTPEGNIAVTDFILHKVLIISADFTSIETVCGGIRGNQQFNRPQGLVVDDNGNIIVSDLRNNRIRIFNSSGIFQCDVEMAANKFGFPELNTPSGIALTPSGKIAVVDFSNNRVAIIS